MAAKNTSYGMCQRLLSVVHRAVKLLSVVWNQRLQEHPRVSPPQLSPILGFSRQKRVLGVGATPSAGEGCYSIVCDSLCIVETLKTVIITQAKVDAHKLNDLVIMSREPSKQQYIMSIRPMKNHPPCDNLSAALGPGCFMPPSYCWAFAIHCVPDSCYYDFEFSGGTTQNTRVTMKMSYLKCDTALSS